MWVIEPVRFVLHPDQATHFECERSSTPMRRYAAAKTVERVTRLQRPLLGVECEQLLQVVARNRWKTWDSWTAVGQAAAVSAVPGPMRAQCVLILPEAFLTTVSGTVIFRNFNTSLTKCEQYRLWFAFRSNVITASMRLKRCPL